MNREISPRIYFDKNAGVGTGGTGSKANTKFVFLDMVKLGMRSGLEPDEIADPIKDIASNLSEVDEGILLAGAEKLSGEEMSE